MIEVSEAELAAAMRASELLDDAGLSQGEVAPTDRYPVAAQLTVEGHSSDVVCRVLTIAPTRFLDWLTKPHGAPPVRLASASHLPDAAYLPASLLGLVE